MKKILLYIFTATMLLTGCITNDLPYPIVVPAVTSIDVNDAVSVEIDVDKQIVTIYLSETTDLRKVVINKVQFSEEIAVPSMNLEGIHDLTKPLKFKINTYQEYTWTLRAVRNIERYFNVDGQVGSSIIDEYNHRAVAMVSEGTDLSEITVTALKLGPRDISEYSKELADMKDFTDGVSIDVKAFGLVEHWTLYVEETDLTVSITDVNPWTYKAYVTALGIAGKDNRFQYRQKGQSEWIDVNPEDVTADGGTFVALIKGLQPSTVYEAVALCGSDTSEPKEFKTDPATLIPNGSFEHVSLVLNANYYKFYDPDCGVEDGSYMFWGSGNGEGSEGVNGSANMGIIITTVDKNDKVDGKQSVCAQTSQMAGILAAGNLFTGQFAGLVGTEGGKVNFGRPWTTRPSALKLYCKYKTGKMDIIKGSPVGVTLTNDDYDRAQIKFALGTWTPRLYGGTKDSPVHVNTTDPKTFVNFSTDENTIAYGELILHHNGYRLNGSDLVTSSTDEWCEYTIPLDYKTLDQRPTHIIISCAASQFGDYFSGCSSSKLWIDKVELVY